jgi:hypothetical protein
MTTTQPGRGRVIGLRVVAAILALMALIASNFTLVLPWIAWLPERTLLSIGLPTEDVPSWLVQGTAIILGGTLLLVGVALQAWRPAANVAALWLISLLLGSNMVLDIVQRDIGDPIWFVAYALFVAIVALHPRRLAPLRPIDPVAATVTVIGAIPLAWFAFEELRQQFAQTDPPDNFHFGMAQAAALVVLGAAIGSTALPGRWLGVATATAMPVLVAVSSIAHPSATSALSTPWAWAAIAWGLTVLVVDRRHLFARRSVEVRAPDPA